ncbi:alpha/beta hydrolase fold [Asanoa hainanensis]|uniref:Alpha/beta hydrolase fold n=1 Tax=Asanoa hainanensis TaxID=560556 RepID=A0A239LQC8_9ACTN|nr:alpha/beta hydrolase [Asanoa hainanensis]SNT32102.1 alpha/beta hydrolase fold [Asanoa hainanensis]
MHVPRRQLRRLVLLGLLAGLLVLTGCTVPVISPNASNNNNAAPSPAAPGQASWKPCPDVPNQLVGRGASNMTYDCATIKVPQDWSDAGNGQTFDVALIRVRNKKQHDRIGSLLVNPGGPGASGVDLAVYLSFGAAFQGIPDEVTQRFDIVGFDPRGVDRSSPVECISDAQLDESFGYVPDPETQAQFDGLVDLNTTIGKECDAKYGDKLKLFSTVQTAKDMDAIRKAVGDEKTTYLGYSYGTLLGATYAQLFPKNVRALVLDGAVDPRQSFVAGSESQAKGFALAFDNFAKWCDSTPDQCPIAPDAKAAVNTQIDKAEVSPVTGAGGRKATSGWVFYAVISSLYTQSGWQALGSAIKALEDGKPAQVFQLADAYAERAPDGTYSNLFDANIAVNCADTKSVPDVNQIRTLQGQWRSQIPMFGAPLAVGMLTCSVWPGGHDPYPTGPATGSAPILVVGTTGDPATPYAQAPALANMLGVGRLLTWEGEGHTAYPQTSCVTEAVDAYLLNLTVPPEGKRCPPK